MFELSPTNQFVQRDVLLNEPGAYLILICQPISLMGSFLSPPTQAVAMVADQTERQRRLVLWQAAVIAPPPLAVAADTIATLN